MIKNYVTYEEFGAVGDGVADDFLPIYKAHNYANENRLSVKATAGKTYRINHTFVTDGEKKFIDSVKIKTSVDWTGANFYIDDSDLNPFDPFYMGMSGRHIFDVISEYEPMKITDPELLKKIAGDGIPRDAKKIDLGFERDYPVMILTCSTSHKVDRRQGPFAYDGNPKHEVIVLDKDGNISEETPLMFDYSDFDYIDVRRIDDTPITLKGGHFTTLACKHNARPTENNPENKKFPYFRRGIDVVRSNVTFDGVKHYMKGETTPYEHRLGKRGPHYGGFYSVSTSNHVTFKNCVLTARRNYNLSGTYELNIGTSNKVVFDGCIQSNFWITVNEDLSVITPCDMNTPGAMPSMAYFDNHGERVNLHWGAGGANFCKNLEYINSTISRLDAHMGLYNGKVINSNVNAIGVIGAGELIVENSCWFSPEPIIYCNHIVGLRDDYGSTWDGTIKLKNVHAYINKDIPSAVLCCNYYNWYNGYTNYQPALIIDGLKLYDIKTKEPLPEGHEIQASKHDNPNGQIIRAHTDISHTQAIYPLTDANGDGYLDDPHDKTKNVLFDGKPITMEYARENRYNPERYPGAYLDVNDYRNTNKKVPPPYIKVLNNDAGYKFVVEKTSGLGIPNGAYHGIEEDGDGGYFGCTKFYYGEDKYILGTSEDTTKLEDCPYVFKQFYKE